MRRKLKKAYAVISLPARMALGCVIMSAKVFADTIYLITDKDLEEK